MWNNAVAELKGGWVEYTPDQAPLLTCTFNKPTLLRPRDPPHLGSPTLGIPAIAVKVQDDAIAVGLDIFQGLCVCC